MKKIFVIIFSCVFMAGTALFSYAEDDPTTRVIKSGLLGAGTGAVAAGMSGGKAGKGALIGAGTSVIGSVLLDAITGGGSRRRRYEEEEYEPYDDLDEYYEEPDPNAEIIKGGLVGAGTGAIAAGVSGGNAGQGALIGAGTTVIGNALLDSITKSSSQRKGRRYRRYRKPQNKIIRHYDENGNLVSEEIIPVE